MNVVVNGGDHEAPDGATVADLLAQLEISGRGVAVELNHEIVPRAQHEKRILQPGDRLEIVSLAGGG